MLTCQFWKKYPLIVGAFFWNFAPISPLSLLLPCLTQEPRPHNTLPIFAAGWKLNACEHYPPSIKWVQSSAGLLPHNVHRPLLCRHTHAPAHTLLSCRTLLYNTPSHKSNHSPHFLSLPPPVQNIIQDPVSAELKHCHSLCHSFGHISFHLQCHNK